MTRLRQSDRNQPQNRGIGSRHAYQLVMWNYMTSNYRHVHMQLYCKVMINVDLINKGYWKWFKDKLHGLINRVEFVDTYCKSLTVSWERNTVQCFPSYSSKGKIYLCIPLLKCSKKNQLFNVYHSRLSVNRHYFFQKQLRDLRKWE